MSDHQMILNDACLSLNHQMVKCNLMGNTVTDALFLKNKRYNDIAGNENLYSLSNVLLLFRSNMFWSVT
jgi:hypothetical protein